MDKATIIKAIIADKEKEIFSWENSARTYNTASDLDENATIDIDDLSQQNQATDLERMANAQLDKAKAELAVLKRYSTHKTDIVEAGALVDVGDKYFFIGPALSNLQAGDKEILFVSEEAPAFATMQGLKKGDVFKLGSNNFKIENIS